MPSNLTEMSRQIEIILRVQLQTIRRVNALEDALEDHGIVTHEELEQLQDRHRTEEREARRLEDMIQPSESLDTRQMLEELRREDEENG